MPLSAALSPSAPRKGTCSAPMSRRKLRQSEVGRTFSVVGSSSPYTANAHTAKSSHPVVGVSSPRGAKGRLWRERLASTKALLGVGTNDACQEVGPCMLASRPTAFRALMKCIRLRWQALDLITDFMADLAQTEQFALSKAPSTTEDPIGELECRTCAQCIALLLRLSMQEAKLHRHCSSSEQLVCSAAKACASCAAIPVLQQPLLSAGLLGVLLPLLNVQAMQNEASTGAIEGKGYVLLEAALQAACSLLAAIRSPQHEALPALVAAVAPLLTAPTPEPLSLFAARALHSLISADEHTRAAVVNMPVALTSLVRACQSTHRAQVLIEAVNTLGSIAASDAHEIALTNAGAIQAFLHICSHANADAISAADDEVSSAATAAMVMAHSKEVQVALDALANLVDSADARRIVVEEGGVQVA